MKRHSLNEITRKLQQASAWVAQGKSQAEIAKALGISVMTYHRWRARYPDLGPAENPEPGASAGGLAEPELIKRIKELQWENARLRRLVTDLLLEKMKLEEARVPKKQEAQ
jgi:putative transposase